MPMGHLSMWNRQIYFLGSPSSASGGGGGYFRRRSYLSIVAPAICFLVAVAPRELN